MSNPKVEVEVKAEAKAADTIELNKITELMNTYKNALYGKDAKTDDPAILNHIEIWADPVHTDISVLKQYVSGLEHKNVNELTTHFRDFVHNHNKVLFLHILPQLELLNELHKMINIADRKLGESDRVKVIGRINEILGNVKPTLSNWLDTQKSLESRLKYEMDVASARPLDKKTGGSGSQWSQNWNGLHSEKGLMYDEKPVFCKEPLYDEEGNLKPNILILPKPPTKEIREAISTPTKEELGGARRRRAVKRTAKKTKRVAKK